ncbi:MAG TPA: hypothetical protein P5086_08865 [Prolixibacteraceae bacterium]|jgi:antitoxin component YwqK of YwqJK toxin-antitoxin module|nr:hypothetical protein [Prolixibacteraceae bacterium]HRV89407.1 hypothetical protein [Prolixibacteraceae bacterium]
MDSFYTSSKVRFSPFNKWIFIIFLLGLTAGWPVFAAAQPGLNQTDANGMKQGPWEKKYPNGRLMYQGSFHDDQPVGTWKRWHESGSLKAILIYSPVSDTIKATLYESASTPVARGLYLGEKKTGTWEYLSNGRTIATEEFSNGRKNGISRKFYTSGELLEESTWTDDLLEGPYRAYFTSGKPFLECRYSKAKRDGHCISYYPSGATEVHSLYLNDLPEGTWTFYSETGGTLYTLQYRQGKLQNPEVLRELDTQKLQELEKQRDRLTDPEKYLEDPEGFMERKR